MSKFFLYDNGCTDETDEVLRPYVEKKIVELIRFPGERMQQRAYEDCVERFHDAARWIAFLDLDEFMVPRKVDSVVEILDSLPKECDQMTMDWLVFGSNGHEKVSPGFVVERFTRCGQRKRFVKSLVNPRHVLRMDCHEHFVVGRTVASSPDVICVHHYHCKSWEEYAQKAAKGEAWGGYEVGRNKYQRACFSEHDLNEVEDLSAVRFLSELKKHCC